MPFIEKLNYTSDLIMMESEANRIISEVGLDPQGQISLKSRVDAVNPWKSGVGSFYNFDTNIFTDTEVNYTEWNLPLGNYIRMEIEALEKEYNFSAGRVRFMLLKSKQGLTVHHDLEVRYHYALETNSCSYFCHNTAEVNSNLTPIGQFYHIPADNHWYLVDTTKTHWVYNGGKKPRLHIVVCSQ